MVQNFKGTVRLSEENYKKLVTTGTLTLNDGTVLTYDPIGTIYITPDSEETAQASDLPTIYDLEAIDADYTYTIVKLEDGTQATLTTLENINAIKNKAIPNQTYDFSLAFFLFLIRILI